MDDDVKNAVLHLIQVFEDMFDELYEVVEADNDIQGLQSIVDRLQTMELQVTRENNFEERNVHGTNKLNRQKRDAIRKITHFENNIFRRVCNHFEWVSSLDKFRSSLSRIRAMCTVLKDTLPDGVFRIDRLESLITKSLRTETALVQKPMEGTDSKIVMKQILVFTFTEQGSFVRELQEDPERCILEAEAFMKLVLAEVDRGVKTLSPCRC